MAFLTVLVSVLSIAAAHPPAEPPLTLAWPAEGTVTDEFGPRWGLVLISHGEGRETLYAHLSHIRAEVGQHLEAGTWIGTAGCTGSCTGTHLHFELRKHGVPVDPMPLLTTRNAAALASSFNQVHRGGKVRGECVAKAAVRGCFGGRNTPDRRYLAGGHPGIK